MGSRLESASLAEEMVSMDDILKSDLAREMTGKMLDGLVDEPNDKDYFLAIAAEIVGGKNLGQAFGFSIEQLDIVKGLAAQQYLAGHYGEAIKLYAFAASMDHFDASALKGLAMCHKQLGIMSEALRYFALSLLIDPDDLESVQMSAECMARMGKRKEALQIVGQIMDRKADPKSRIASMPALLERAKNLQELILRQTH